MATVSRTAVIRPEPWSRKAWRSIREFARAKPLGMAAAIVFLLMILVAIFGQWMTPHDPLDTDVRNRLQGPSWNNFMGTDNLGRDVFSRLVAGTRIAILIGVVASFLGSTIGALLGVVSGYLGGKFDLYFQRLMDMIMAFPYLILAIAIMAVLGGSIQNVIFAIAFPMIPSGNRIARSVAISVRESTFIEAARSLGARQTRIILRHVLPNAVAAYLVTLTSALGASILAEASLSFLGLGVPPPHPSWGRALNEAMSYFYNAPWLAIFPGIAISLAVFSANLFGDALRDVWDPRLKRV